jgi:hypothetical protein
MGVDFRIPNINGATEREQIAQIKSFLYQHIQELNYAFNTIGISESSPVQLVQNVIGGGSESLPQFGTVDIKDKEGKECGVWYYRKQGVFAECWGFIETTPTKEKNSTLCYFDQYTYPFEFVGLPPVEVASIKTEKEGDYTMTILPTLSAEPFKNTSTWYIDLNTAQNPPPTVYLNFYVFGKLNKEE